MNVLLPEHGHLQKQLNASQHYRLATSPPIFPCMRMGGSTKNCCTLMVLYTPNVSTHKHSSCVQCLVEMKIISIKEKKHTIRR